MWLITKFRFQECQAIIDEVIADVLVWTRLVFLFRCEIDGCLCDLEFAGVSSLADPLDNVAVAVTRGKLHSRIHTGGIVSEQRLDQTDFFEKVVPVERREQAHTRDDVADRDLCCRLSLVFGMDDLFDARALFRELLFDPVHHRHYGRMLFAQALNELDQECFTYFFSFAVSLVEGRHHACRLEGSEFEQLIGEFVGFVAFSATARDRDCKAAQIFDKREAEGDGDSPQFTDRKRRDSLISADEALQRVGVEARVSVYDQLERNGIDSWEAF